MLMRLPPLSRCCAGCGRTEKVERSLVWFGTGNMRWLHGIKGKVADQCAAPLTTPCPGAAPALRLAC